MQKYTVTISILGFIKEKLTENEAWKKLEEDPKAIREN